VLALLGVLVFLAAEYEEVRDQSALEADAEALSSDIRSALVRNVQTLQSLYSLAASPGAWSAPAGEVLAEHREMVRLEWRDNARALIAHRDTPYLADLFSYLDRSQALPDMRQACDNAQRSSGPSYSPSYFWPMNGGLGLELMDMCLPVVRNGKPAGFLVVTYSLPGLLAELGNRTLLRGRGLAFVDTDGTRLAPCCCAWRARASAPARPSACCPTCSPPWSARSRWPCLPCSACSGATCACASVPNTNSATPWPFARRWKTPSSPACARAT